MRERYINIFLVFLNILNFALLFYYDSLANRDYVASMLLTGSLLFISMSLMIYSIKESLVRVFYKGTLTIVYGSIFTNLFLICMWALWFLGRF